MDRPDAAARSPTPSSEKMVVVKVWKWTISKAPYSASRARHTTRQPPVRAGSDLAQRDPREGGNRAQTQAAGHLLLGAVGPPQGGRDGDVHQRVEAERHDQGGAGQTLDGRGDRMPGVADHEVGNGDGQDDEDRPDPPAGEIGPLQQEGGARADHRREPRRPGRPAGWC